jgi:8-hydroxy-5-deazaflavin:NADPH oxidoreductase
MEIMKIGIIGSGEVGRKLADGLLDLGHQVKIGTRDTSKKEVVEWIDKHRKKGDKEAENASVGDFVEAAAFGDDLIVLCTSWSGTSNAIKMADPGNMTGKVVIDTTNPLDFSQGLPPRMAVGVTDSAGEINQRLLPGAKVVKALILSVIHIWSIQIFLVALLLCSYAETMNKLRKWLLKVF